jgi:hypothetical protein
MGATQKLFCLGQTLHEGDEGAPITAVSRQPGKPAGPVILLCRVDGDVRVDEQACLAGGVYLVGLAIDRAGAVAIAAAGRGRGPACTAVDHIAGLAQDQQLVRLIREVEHVEHAKGEGIAAGSTDVDTLDGAGAAVRQRGQVEMQTGAVKLQRIRAVSAIGNMQIENRKPHQIVAGAALERVRAAVADQQIVTGTTLSLGCSILDSECSANRSMVTP